jgi:hypothetical protein
MIHYQRPLIIRRASNVLLLAPEDPVQTIVRQVSVFAFDSGCLLYIQALRHITPLPCQLNGSLEQASSHLRSDVSQLAPNYVGALDAQQ